MLVIGVLLVQAGDPFLDGGDDLLGVAAAQFDLGAVAHAVFRLLEQVQQLLDRLAVDLGRLQTAAGPRR